MADEPQSPEDPERSEEEGAAFAEHRAVPTEEAAEIAGSVEDAPLEAFEEAQSATEETQVEQPAQASAEEEAVAAEPAAEEPPAEEAVAEEAAIVEAVAEELAVEALAEELVAEELAVDEAIVEELVEELVVEEAVAELVAEESAGEPPTGVEQPSAEPAAQEPAAEAEEEDFEEDEEEPAPRVKPAVPGAHLEVDIVPEGADPLGRDVPEDPYAIEDEETEGAQEQEEAEEVLAQPISTAAIDLAAGARYRATGKRKTAIARVTLRPGSGAYLINGRTLEEHFPRVTLQRNIRQPLETVGYEDRMDVVARLHGGGISAQAGALRHGVSRALLEADPNLRGELKRRGFLTRDSRAKERKKAGLKKARKRPQFSKR
jgi:small subunit ribosomal protein S9